MSERNVTPSVPAVPAIPPGPFGKRILAFLVDWIFLSFFTAVLLLFIIFPQFFPGVLEEFIAHSQPPVEVAENGEAEPPEWSEEALHAQRVGWNLSVDIFWLYFAISGFLLRGCSPAQALMRLEVVSIQSGYPASGLRLFLRSGLKAICMIHPLFALGLLVAIFVSSRRALHDLVAGTMLTSSDGRRS